MNQRECSRNRKYRPCSLTPLSNSIDKQSSLYRPAMKSSHRDGRPLSLTTQVSAHILPLVLRRLSLLLPRKRSHSINPAFRSTSSVGTRKSESGLSVFSFRNSNVHSRSFPVFLSSARTDLKYPSGTTTWLAPITAIGSPILKSGPQIAYTSTYFSCAARFLTTDSRFFQIPRLKPGFCGLIFVIRNVAPELCTAGAPGEG